MIRRYDPDAQPERNGTTERAGVDPWADFRKGVYLMNDQPFTCPVCGLRTHHVVDGVEACPEHCEFFVEDENAEG